MYRPNLQVLELFLASGSVKQLNISDSSKKYQRVSLASTTIYDVFTQVAKKKKRGIK